MIDAVTTHTSASARSVATVKQIPATAIADTELLAPLRAGEDWAFEVFVHRYTPRLLAVARRFLRSEEDRADAVQDAFLCACRSLGSFAGQAQLSTWLYRIIVNVCLARLRAQSRRGTVPLDDCLPGSDESCGSERFRTRPAEEVVSQLVRAETRAQVRACLGRLPEAYRTVLKLRDLDDLDTDQTAHIIGATRAAVKTRLHRARQALGTLLEPLLGI